MGQDCNQRKLGTTLIASIHPSGTGFCATETAFIRPGLQSTAPGPHYLRLDESTVSSACPQHPIPLCAGKRPGGAPVSYASRPGHGSVSLGYNSPYRDTKTVSPAMSHAGRPQEDKAREEPARAVGWGGGSVADNVVLVRLIAVPCR